MHVVLASSSERRKRILSSIIPNFDIFEPNIKERIASSNFLSEAKRLAKEKALKASKKYPDAIIISADTIAYKGKNVFGKTSSPLKAKRILRMLSGKKHNVVTGVAIFLPNGRLFNFAKKATVFMKKLSDKDIRTYILDGEWKGRAGCYDITGKGRRLIKRILGEKETVAGLPVRKLKTLIKIHVI